MFGYFSTLYINIIHLFQHYTSLARIAPFMNVSKKQIILKSFIESQFGYCPLIWMFHSGGLNNKINRVHKRALRITYNDKSSSYGELLTKDRSVAIHHGNIRALAIEIYKVCWQFPHHF